MLEKCKVADLDKTLCLVSPVAHYPHSVEGQAFR